jgi:hypothetical protein
MWQSRPAGANASWVTVDVNFPAAVTLTGIGIHSQHSGHHAADALRVEVASAGDYVPVGETVLESVDQMVPIPARTARSWRFWFHAADGKAVVLRGLRFFSRNGEIVPPVVPFGA